MNFRYTETNQAIGKGNFRKVYSQSESLSNYLQNKAD